MYFFAKSGVLVVWVQCVVVCWWPSSSSTPWTSQSGRESQGRDEWRVRVPYLYMCVCTYVDLKLIIYLWLCTCNFFYSTALPLCVELFLRMKGTNVNLEIRFVNHCNQHLNMYVVSKTEERRERKEGRKGEGEREKGRWMKRGWRERERERDRFVFASLQVAARVKTEEGVSSGFWHKCSTTFTTITTVLMTQMRKATANKGTEL